METSLDPRPPAATPAKINAGDNKTTPSTLNSKTIPVPSKRIKSPPKDEETLEGGVSDEELREASQKLENEKQTEEWDFKRHLNEITPKEKREVQLLCVFTKYKTLDFLRKKFRNKNQVMLRVQQLYVTKKIHTDHIGCTCRTGYVGVMKTELNHESQYVDNDYVDYLVDNLVYFKLQSYVNDIAHVIENVAKPKLAEWETANILKM